MWFYLPAPVFCLILDRFEFFFFYISTSLVTVPARDATWIQSDASEKLLTFITLSK